MHFRIIILSLANCLRKGTAGSAECNALHAYVSRTLIGDDPFLSTILHFVAVPTELNATFTPMVHYHMKRDILDDTDSDLLVI